MHPQHPASFAVSSDGLTAKKKHRRHNYSQQKFEKSVEKNNSPSLPFRFFLIAPSSPDGLYGRIDRWTIVGCGELGNDDGIFNSNGGKDIRQD